eukprot:scaffold90546_cov42-Phaeocystis_antarctica.AAC.1
MMRVPTPTTPDDALRRGNQRATLDPLGASRPSSALAEPQWWPQRAAAGGVGEADGETGGTEERASMAAAATSNRSAVARHQPLAVRCSLPLAAAESCSPRPCAPVPLCPGPRCGGGGLAAAEVLDEMSSSWPLGAPPLSGRPPGGPPGLSGSQPALRDGPARSLQPLPSTAEATATAPGALLPLSSPQRLPPRSAQPVGLRTSKSVGALGGGRQLAAIPPPSPGSTVLRSSCSAAAHLHGGLSLARMSALEMRPSSLSSLSSREAAPLMSIGRDGRKLSQFDVWLQQKERSGERVAGTTQPAFPPSSQHPIPRITSKPSPLRTGRADVGSSPARTAAAPLFNVRPPSWGELAGPYAALLAGMKSPSKIKRGATSPIRTADTEGGFSQYMPAPGEGLL